MSWKIPGVLAAAVAAGLAAAALAANPATYDNVNIAGYDHVESYARVAEPADSDYVVTGFAAEVPYEGEHNGAVDTSEAIQEDTQWELHGEIKFAGAQFVLGDVHVTDDEDLLLAAGFNDRRDFPYYGSPEEGPGSVSLVPGVYTYEAHTAVKLKDEMLYQSWCTAEKQITIHW